MDSHHPYSSLAHSMAYPAGPLLTPVNIQQVILEVTCSTLANAQRDSTPVLTYHNPFLAWRLVFIYAKSDILSVLF